MAILRRAGAMLSKVAVEVLALVEPGRQEVSVAAEIDALLRRAGFSRPAFETIVASGPNSALPHARPGARRAHAGRRRGAGLRGRLRRILRGFDADGSAGAGDVTRSCRMFEAVRAAQAAAIAAVRPWSAASAVDAAAREVLAARGLGDAFVHGTGHGLGLEVHEEPRITRPGSAATRRDAAAGMVFTVEPGAYLPGVGRRANRRRRAGDRRSGARC